MLPCIVAPATPPGHAALGVVRLSGREARSILVDLGGRCPTPRLASLRTLRDTEGVIDQALVTYFPAPQSYTGEDVVELSCHGNPLIVERLLRRCVQLGARLASPGEFTRRAVQNGKIDVLGAEQVLATIEATSPAGLALATGLDTLRSHVRGLCDRLTDIAAELEASVDYPGEGLEFASDDDVRGRLLAVSAEARSLARGWDGGRVAVQGATVALVGAVNAGKSSLFNALLETERAIVSEQPGTTRDVVECVLRLTHGRVTLLDTAGQRETDDVIEQRGLALGSAAATRADLRLLCVPVTHTGALPDVPDPRLVIATQADLGEPQFACDHIVSAKTGVGIADLRERLLEPLVGQVSEQTALLSSARQQEVLLALAQAAQGAGDELILAGPVVALASLHRALGFAVSIEGGDSVEAVLDRLFARFCVGK